MYKTIALKPRMSEKAYGLSQTARTYVFEVPKGTNKQSVAHAVALQFDVVVASVNIANIAGKAKRSVRKGGRQVKGYESDTRKAYVTLTEGQSLPIFAAAEEAEAKEEATQAKVDKALTKQAQKEAKPIRRGIRRAKKEENA